MAGVDRDPNGKVDSGEAALLYQSVIQLDLAAGFDSNELRVRCRVLTGDVE